jgi:membrane associated rhomboid family serine protease
MAGYRGYGGAAVSASWTRGWSIVRWLLTLNIGIFLLHFFLSLPFGENIFYWLELTPARLVGNFAIWQLLTYQFLHSVTDPFHIVFNMLTLWMFGRELERVWGSAEFLRFYLTCGVGAGLCIVVYSYLFGNPGWHVIGASGALFGVMIAVAMLFPDAQAMFNFLFPIKVKWLVLILASVSFLMLLRGSNAGGNVAHLGGLAVGYAYLKWKPKRRRAKGQVVSPLSWLTGIYKKWKMERAKRQFEVYMRRQDRERYH